MASWKITDIVLIGDTDIHIHSWLFFDCHLVVVRLRQPTILASGKIARHGFGYVLMDQGQVVCVCCREVD